MKRPRHAVLRSTVLVSVAVSACTSTADGSDADGAAGVIAAELLAHPRADLETRDARCIADTVVENLGVDRLAELGLDVAEETAALLTVPPMTDDEGDEVYAAYDTCLDFTQGDVDNFVTAGLSEAEAECASEHYRSSPLPQAHLLLENHDTVPHDELHAGIEALWEESQAVCR